jgi:hypothetical protein
MLAVPRKLLKMPPEVLPEKVQLVTVRNASSLSTTPRFEVLLENVQPVTEAAPANPLRMPPPKTPKLPEKVQSFAVRVACALKIAPPKGAILGNNILDNSAVFC